MGDRGDCSRGCDPINGRVDRIPPDSARDGDSGLHRSGQGAFQPTLANSALPPGKPHHGMGWIPDGEFSMGATDPQGLDRNDVWMHATEDSRPIHRVYVDGFWMDKTDVTQPGRDGSVGYSSIYGLLAGPPVTSLSSLRLSLDAMAPVR